MVTHSGIAAAPAGALPVDLEHDVPACVQALFDGLACGAIEIVEYLGVLEELPSAHQLAEVVRGLVN